MDKKERKKLFKEAMGMELRQNRKSYRVYLVLRAIVIAVLVRQAFLGNFENVFMCALTLALFMIPSFIQVKYRVEIPAVLEIIILMFIFSAEILGEVNEFYIKIPYWDTILHTLNGFLAAAIGFSLVNLLNENKSLSFNLSPFFVAVVAFCFSMTIGVLWEFFEFFMDTYFGMDMQKDTIIHSINSVLLNPSGRNTPFRIRGITSTTVNSVELGIDGYLDIGLIDTMKDLFVNFIGAVVFSVIGYFYIKNKGKSCFAPNFIPSPKDEHDDFLTKLKNTAVTNNDDCESSEKSEVNENK
ncbi:MAG: hypothetical protein PUD43_02070 [Clostridia bacterium]|nr:hypothetical protein [Clostridia bacterium]